MGRNYVENRKTKTKGSVYVIRCGDLFKIGATRNVYSRFNSLQTSNPQECEMILELKSNNMFLTERLLKSKYSRLNMKGEWFKLTPLDVFNIRIGNYDERITKSTGNTKKWTQIPSVI